MKYKTRKDRAELYLMAAQILDEGTTGPLVAKSEGEAYQFLSSPYCCDILAGLSGLYSYGSVTEELFPEFFMFEPDKIEGYTGWWDDSDNETRVIAFLLASEIARHP